MLAAMAVKTHENPITSPKALPAIYTRHEHTVSRRDIDADALKIMYRLIRAGYRAYLVGGGVRDLLLGIKPKDFDIGTDARPNQIRTLFRNSRIIGRRFRLVHIFFGGNKIIEVATFRAADSSPPEVEDESNGEGDTREPAEKPERLVINENEYGTDETDAFRRDLTINALFYDLSTFSIIDYVGGVKDLKEGLIRIVGDPTTRLREDPVRLLRTVRHAARTGFQIEPKTLTALLENRTLIRRAAPMRLYEELKKDFKSGCFLRIVKALHQNQLLEFLIPELSDHNGALITPGHPLHQCLETVDRMSLKGQEVSPTVILSIIALFADCPTSTLEAIPDRFESHDEVVDHISDVLRVLAVPRKERERIMTLIDAWLDMRSMPITRIKLPQLARRPFFQDLYTLLEIVAVQEADKKLLELCERATGGARAERAARPVRPRNAPRRSPASSRRGERTREA
jgi:poly(A) polymerase